METPKKTGLRQVLYQLSSEMGSSIKDKQIQTPNTSQPQSDQPGSPTLVCLSTTLLASHLTQALLSKNGNTPITIYSYEL